jgi:hypothetical protein
MVIHGTSGNVISGFYLTTECHIIAVSAPLGVFGPITITDRFICLAFSPRGGSLSRGNQGVCMVASGWSRPGVKPGFLS